MPSVWPGVCSGRIRSSPTLSRSPGVDRAGGAAATSSRSSGLISTGDPGPARGQLAERLDVVVVVVGQQHHATASRREPLGGLERAARPARRRRSRPQLPPASIADEVAVREVAGVAASVR